MNENDIVRRGIEISVFSDGLKLAAIDMDLCLSANSNVVRPQCRCRGQSLFLIKCCQPNLASKTDGPKRGEKLQQISGSHDAVAVQITITKVIHPHDLTTAVVDQR